MKRKLAAIALLLALAPLAGCSKDDDVKNVVAEINTFTTDLVGKVESAPDPSSGVDAAQKHLDAKKADIQAKLESIKQVRGFQVSKETMAQMQKDIQDDAMKVMNLQLKYATKAASDSAFNAKLEKLTKDYTDLLTMA